MKQGRLVECRKFIIHQRIPEMRMFPFFPPMEMKFSAIIDFNIFNTCLMIRNHFINISLFCLFVFLVRIKFLFQFYHRGIIIN